MAAEQADLPAAPGSGATGWGLATLAADGGVIEARFPVISLDAAGASGTVVLTEAAARERLGRSTGAACRRDERRDVRVVPVETRIADLSAPVADNGDLFLRLHLLSGRWLTPEQVSLRGMLDQFRTVAWTSLGPCLPERVDELRWLAAAEGTALQVSSVWPFPRMTDYVMPSGVRITNGENVRLGAYLAPGTTVNGNGYCNTGSATLGAVMVEGRLSFGVSVGAGSHIGGGASLMGTTSGGGTLHVSIGRDCLVGANAGVGIALGDGCVVEAGCYVTAGAKVTLPDGQVVKAAAVSGSPRLLFRRNTETGRLEALPSPGWAGLHPALHGADPGGTGVSTSAPVVHR